MLFRSEIAVAQLIKDQRVLCERLAYELKETFQGRHIKLVEEALAYNFFGGFDRYSDWVIHDSYGDAHQDSLLLFKKLKKPEVSCFSL